MIKYFCLLSSLYDLALFEVKIEARCDYVSKAVAGHVDPDNGIAEAATASLPTVAEECADVLEG